MDLAIGLAILAMGIACLAMALRNWEGESEMSYAVTDAVEADHRAELEVVLGLNESIDQLAASASGFCSDAEEFLALAWCATEHAIREAGGLCSANCGGVNSCACCAHYARTMPKYRRLRKML